MRAGGKRFVRHRCAAIAACAAMLCAAPASALFLCVTPASARADADADSAIAYRWSALYANRIGIDATSPTRGRMIADGDRLAVLGEVSHRWGIAAFAKGATVFRLGGEHHDQRFILDQGHIGFDALGGAAKGRLFTRERAYRTDQRLFPLSSDEWPSIVDRGEGLALDLRAGDHIAFNYIESILRDDVSVRGGLPSYHGDEDRFRVLRLEGCGRTRWHAGSTISEMRDRWGGDWITVGTDLGFRVKGIDILAELARTRRGGWSELRNGALFDLRWKDARLDDFDALFSENDAFAAEAEGLRLGMGGLGAVGFVPGYRFIGSAFESVNGEFGTGRREGYLTAWWKPAENDALLSLDAADCEERGRDCSRLIGSLRMRYRGGFEIRESVICRTGERSSAALSMIDDNALSRIVMTARMDDLGDGNLLSFLAQGTLNLGSRVSAKSVLYLRRSSTSLYNVEVEFRPRESFLFQASIGSFWLEDEIILIDRRLDGRHYMPYGSDDRLIRIFARVWFGGEGER